MKKLILLFTCVGILTAQAGVIRATGRGVRYVGKKTYHGMKYLGKHVY